ncbi:MAG: pyruvate dehydrogenase (acetyl-transferring) E1 component subunit alpha [Sphingobacteriaceae bacterium]|nr:pyruvate dehydrogenase (acetyl-transferring) E1 component subunit alpha [Sphingobacteriaceae bacterium]
MAKAKVTKETYLQWYEQMQLIRRFEEKCAQLYGQQKIKGFCHLYIGQEAVVAGTYSVITSEDSVITAYRDHGHALACGMTPESVMAELYGKVTGCSKGKGGSMHMFSKQFRNFGGHGIVGGQVPLGAGIAFAEQYLGTKNVNICYMGDGAVRQGALHETFNMAMLWKLPVVFVVENNFYAMGTSLERTTNLTDIYKMGLAYDMPSQWVDGMSCEAVHEAMAVAVERARKGDGPTFLEIRTYRYRGHSMSDPAKYRTKEEVEDYKSKDPITVTRETILKKKYATEAELSAIDEKIEEQVKASVEFAENSPWPDVSELYTDVYEQADYPFIMD